MLKLSEEQKTKDAEEVDTEILIEVIDKWHISSSELKGLFAEI